jgi:DNA-binding transcriptional regulator PaaX
LPAALLPEGWLGVRAAEMFNGYRSLLSAQSAEFIEATLNNPGGWKR